MGNKGAKKGHLLVFFLILLVILSSCSAKETVRLKGVHKLGDLPSDMLYIDDVPQIVTVSTESDGDILLSYISTNKILVVQMYGCNYINLVCAKIHKQGRYEWNLK